MKRIIFVFFLLITFKSVGESTSYKLTSKKCDEILSFAKLYGYVKYFHPSDEAAELDWDAFAVYGIQRILVSNGKDINDILKELFNPIAPSIEFVDKKNNRYIDNLFDKKIKDYSDEKFLMWIHNGDGKLKLGRTYKSKRIEVNGSDIDKKTYSVTLEIDSKSIIVPHYIMANKTEISSELKVSYQNLLSKLKEVRKNYSELETSREFIFGYLVNAFNSIKHFYPYFNKSYSKQWDNHFSKLIQTVLNSSESLTAVNWLRLLLTELKDAHVDVYIKKENIAYPDIFIRYVENQYVVYNATDNYSSLKGKVIKKIDGKSISKLVEEEIKLVSFGVKDFGIQETLKNILARRPFSSIKVELEGSSSSADTIINMNCFMGSGSYAALGEYTKIRDVFSEIDTRTCYLNLVELKSLDDQFTLNKLSNYENVIIDLRGYPTLNSKDKNELLSFFLNEIDTLNWLFVPIVKQPNLTDEDYTYKPSSWSLPKNDEPVDLNLFILIDHMAISYAESIIGYFAKLPNARLVGTPTAGANGNVNIIELPRGVIYEYTGMKVLKHDGSRLHGIGFLPDVEVRPTIQGIREGRDEVLEKAIELASEEKDKREKKKD